MMVLFTQLLHNTEKNTLLSAATYFTESVVEKEIQKATSVLQAAHGNNSIDPFNPKTIILVLKTIKSKRGILLHDNLPTPIFGSPRIHPNHLEPTSN